MAIDDKSFKELAVSLCFFIYKERIQFKKSKKITESNFFILFDSLITNYKKEEELYNFIQMFLKEMI